MPTVFFFCKKKFVVTAPIIDHCFSAALKIWKQLFWQVKNCCIYVNTEQQKVVWHPKHVPVVHSKNSKPLGLFERCWLTFPSVIFLDILPYLSRSSLPVFICSQQVSIPVPQQKWLWWPFHYAADQFHFMALMHLRICTKWLDLGWLNWNKYQKGLIIV